MTEDLMTDLRAVGDLLDERAERAMTDLAPGDDGVRPLPLAPAGASSPRRRQAVGAAAALVLLAAAVAVVAWNRRDDSLPVASVPATVAFVPASLDGWDRVTAYSPGDEELVESETNLVVLARLGTDPGEGPSVSLTTFDVQSAPPPSEPAERVDVGGREGWLVDDAGGRRALQVLPPGGTGTMLLATADAALPAAEMIELVAAFDPDRPLVDQPVPAGWVREVDGRDLAAAVSRTVSLTSESGTADPMGATFVSVASVANISHRAALWFLATPSSERVTVRGTEAWLSHETSPTGSYGTLSWIEDDLVVAVSFNSGDPGVDGRALMLEVAESLVPVDAAGWAELVGRANDGPGGSVGAGEDGIVTDTTMPASPDTPTTTILTFPPVQGATDLIEGSINGERGFQVYVLASTGQLCWVLEGEANPHCDPEGAMGADGEQAIQPRVATDEDGTTLFLYGFMAPGSVDVDVVAVNQTGSRTVSAMGSGSIWVAPVPPGYGAADVEYLDEAGNVVAAGSLS